MPTNSPELVDIGQLNKSFDEIAADAILANSLTSSTIQTDETVSTVHVSTATYGGADIGEAFNNARGIHGDNNIVYDFEKGVHDLTTTLDLTDIDPPESERDGVDIDLRGTHLNHKVDIGFDCTGSNTIRFWGGRIIASGSYSADVCFLMARNNQYPPATAHKFYGTKVVGPFDTAIYYNLNSERNYLYGCIFSNKSGNNYGPTGSQAVYLGTTNEAGIQSKYSTIETKVTLNDTTFYGGALLAPVSVRINQGTDSTGAQRVIHDTTFNQVYFEGDETMCQVDLSNGADEIRGIAFNNCRLSDSQPENGFSFSSGGVAKTVRGFSVRGGAYHVPSTGNREILSDSSITFDRALISRDVRWANANGLLLGGVDNSEINVDGSTPLIISGDIEDSTVFASDITYQGGTTRVMEFDTAGTEIKLLNTTAGEEFRLSRTHFGSTATRNLANVTPDFDGQCVRDNGTNFAPGEYAYADTTNGVWRAFSDPSNATVAY